MDASRVRPFARPIGRWNNFRILRQGTSSLAKKQWRSQRARRLAGDVFSWAGSIQDGIWVYQEGHWSKSQALWNAIQRTSWDNVCLDPEFLRNLRGDIRAFFDNAKIYQSLGIAWKRGILLLGPPGNGKTESIKVLLKESDQVALYVKSFGADGVSRTYLAMNSV